MLYKIKDQDTGEVIYQGSFDRLYDFTATALFVHGVDPLDIARMPELNVPVIPNIDSAILADIKQSGFLDMQVWHATDCNTTHCRGGWAIHKAGQAGYDLEKLTGAAMAARLIYAASRPDMEVPDFHTTNDEAMSDLIRCAAMEQEKVQ